jgi:hypothetical protein
MIEIAQTTIICLSFIVSLLIINMYFRKFLISKSHVRLFARRSETLLADKCRDLEAQNLDIKRRLDKIELMISAMSMQMGVRIER